MFRQPNAVLQTESRDCGYSCVSLLLDLHDIRVHPHALKSLFGPTSRGLSLRAMIEMSQSLGLRCDAICFDAKVPSSLTFPCIALVNGSHFVVLLGLDRRRRVKGFDPTLGWFVRGYGAVRRTLDGVAIVPRERIVATSEPPIAPRVQWKKLFPVRPSKRGTAVAVLLTAATQGLLAVVPQFSASAVDAHVDRINSLPLSILGAYLAVNAVSAVSVAASTVVIAKVQRVLKLGLDGRMLQQLLGARSTYATMSPSDRYMIMSLASRLQQIVGLSGTALVFGTLAGVVATVLLFSASPSLAALSLAGVVASAGAASLFSNAMRAAFSANLHAGATYRAFLLDVFSSVGAIARLSDRSRVARMGRRFGSLAGRAELQEVSVDAGKAAVLSGITTLDRVIFAAICGVLISEKALTVGAFVAAGLYREQIRSAFTRVVDAVQQLMVASAQWPQLAPFLADDELPRGAPIAEGRIDVIDATFAYDLHALPCLSGFSLRVRAGEFVALKGPSGCGKSTLLALIAGDLTPQDGQVLLGGQAAGGRPPGVAAVLPSDRLVAGTIEDNVRFFRRGITEREIDLAFREAGVSEFLSSISGGAKAYVSEGCPSISSGQRQRILLARALCRWEPILLLDEATSNLDVSLEADILRAIKRSGRTIVMVAHRPEAWEIADRVIDMTRSAVPTPLSAIDQIPEVA